MSTEPSSPADFKAEMIERHRSAFELWRRTQEMLEAAVPRGRDLSHPFPRVIDILFIQAFKSHGSLYPLCVGGQGEDAGTILRRILEIVFQAAYVCGEPNHRHERSERYLAWFWSKAPDLLKRQLAPEARAWWQTQYDQHKHYLLNANGKAYRNWWGQESLRDLARQTGMEERYKTDYPLLSQMAHCTAPGLLLERHEDVIEVRTRGRPISVILVFGTGYLLDVARLWNEHFGLMDKTHLAHVVKEVAGFDWDQIPV